MSNYPALLTDTGLSTCGQNIQYLLCRWSGTESVFVNGEFTNQQKTAQNGDAAAAANCFLNRQLNELNIVVEFKENPCGAAHYSGLNNL